jgi:hypothetical protein
LHCKQNLTSIGLAVKAYAISHGGALPTMGAGLPEELKPYLPATTEWWTCPATKRPYRVRAAKGMKATDPIAWDDGTSSGLGPHGKKWHVLNADGTVVDATAPPALTVTVVRGLEAPVEAAPARLRPKR